MYVTRSHSDQLWKQCALAVHILYVSNISTGKKEKEEDTWISTAHGESFG